MRHPFREVYTDNNLQLTVADDDPLPPGGVAFGGNGTLWDDAKVGHDNNGDFDIADDGDDIIWDESFGSTSKSVSYDHAGNLIDDGVFRYVYDAWNRLVKVQSSLDSGATTFQQAEFDGTGRRIKKVVTNSGDLNATIRYYYDGQKIIETRLPHPTQQGQTVMYQQFVHGTQYIDELVMIRVKDKGDLYVHQDANWNVIGLTDLGGSLVERYVYTPYGELTVYEETGYGDYDGDGDVKGNPPSDSDPDYTAFTGVCAGSRPTGACRILDLDFDGEVDTTDRDSYFANLPQGLARHPGRIATSVHQPFGHQGLLYEPEVGQYQNRARQYDPGKRRFVQRDRAGYHDGCNLFAYVANAPLRFADPLGRTIGLLGPFVSAQMNVQEVLQGMLRPEGVELGGLYYPKYPALPEYQAVVTDTDVAIVNTPCTSCPTFWTRYVTMHWEPAFNATMTYVEVTATPEQLAQYPNLESALDTVMELARAHEQQHYSILTEVFVGFDTFGVGAACSNQGAIEMAVLMNRLQAQFTRILLAQENLARQNEWDTVDRPRLSHDVVDILQDALLPP